MDIYGMTDNVVQYRGKSCNRYGGPTCLLHALPVISGWIMLLVLLPWVFSTSVMCIQLHTSLDCGFYHCALRDGGQFLNMPFYIVKFSNAIQV